MTKFDLQKISKSLNPFFSKLIKRNIFSDYTIQLPLFCVCVCVCVCMYVCVGVGVCVCVLFVLFCFSFKLPVFVSEMNNEHGIDMMLSIYT